MWDSALSKDKASSDGTGVSQNMLGDRQARNKTAVAKFRPRRRESQKAMEESIRAIKEEESARPMEATSSRLQCSPGTLRLRLNEAITREKSLQEQIRSFQSTLLDPAIRPQQTPSRFPSPTTLIDAARGEQEDGHESCHRLDNDIHHVRFDMVREKGNMNDSIMVASPPSTSTSTSALIDPGIGNVPQPSSRSVRPVNLEAGSHLLLEDSLPGPSRDDDGISHPDIRKNQNKKRLRGSEDDELQCDRAHFFDHLRNKRPRNPSESELNPSGQALAETPVTVSDGQSVSPKKEGVFASRKRSASTGKERVRRSPVTAARTQPRSSFWRNPPVSILPPESWKDSTPALDTADVAGTSGSFIPLRVTTLHPMQSFTTSEQSTQTLPIVPLLSAPAPPMPQDMGTCRQQIPASSERDATRERSETERTSEEEKPSYGDQVIVDGESEVVKGIPDEPNSPSMAPLEDDARDTPFGNRTSRSTSRNRASRSRTPKVDSVSPTSSRQFNVPADEGKGAQPDLVRSLLQYAQDLVFATHRIKDAASATNELLGNHDHTDNGPMASSRHGSSGCVGGEALDTNPTSRSPHPGANRGKVPYSNFARLDQLAYKLSDDTTPTVASPTHNAISQSQVPSIPPCDVQECREAKVLSVFLNWVSSADARREEELDELTSKIRHLESQLALFQQENTQLKAILNDRNTKAYTDSSTQHIQAEQFSMGISTDDFQVNVSSPEDLSNRSYQSVGVQLDVGMQPTEVIHDSDDRSATHSGLSSSGGIHNVTSETRSSSPSQSRATQSQSRAKRKYRPTGESSTGQTNAFTSGDIVAGASPTLHSGRSASSSLVSNEHGMTEDVRTGSDGPHSREHSVVGQSSQCSTSSSFASPIANKGFAATELVNLVTDLSVRESSGTGEDNFLSDQQNIRRSRVPGFLNALRLLEAEADKWLEGQASRHSLL